VTLSLEIQAGTAPSRSFPKQRRNVRTSWKAGMPSVPSFVATASSTVTRWRPKAKKWRRGYRALL